MNFPITVSPSKEIGDSAIQRKKSPNSAGIKPRVCCCCCCFDFFFFAGDVVVVDCPRVPLPTELQGQTAASRG